MKKFKIYPKIFISHFKKRPSRIVTWFSILAVIFALVITNLKLDQIIPRAHAAEIKIEGDKITLFGETNRSNFFTTADNYKILLNDFIIDVDGYLQARWYPDPTNRPYGFEYVYVRNDNGAIKIKPDAGKRIKVDATKDLVIPTGTRVYLEGNSTRSLNLKSLTIDGAGALLTHVPANRDGLAAPFSTNNYWGVQFFGYYYLGPNREVEFKLNTAGDDTIQLWVSRGTFSPEGPDSPWGQRFRLKTSGTEYCSVADSSGWCKDNSNKTVKFSNPIATKGLFLGVQLLASKKDGNVEFSLTHREGAIDQPLTTGLVPTTKFVAVNNNPAQGSVGAPLDGGLTNTDPYFATYIQNNTNNGMIGLAYYYDVFGVKLNHYSFNLPDGMLNFAPRSFQATSVSFDGWGIRNYGLQGDNVKYANATYPAFKMRWEETGKGSYRGNPISWTIMPQGEDYLRAPLAGYVEQALVAEDKVTPRQARINLNVSGDVTLSGGGAIDISGKGFPGGITNERNFKFPNSQFGRYSDKEDNPIHGAGFAGGAGGWTETEPYAYSGSYGGAGVFTRQTYDVVENNAYPALAGNVYGGGDKVSEPKELGSGGGYYQDRAGGADWAAIGGAGGGALKITANKLSIDASSSIKANGGNGFVGVPGEPNPMAETRGVLGKPGVKRISSRSLTDNQWATKYRGTAGSGGSIWLKINDKFNNQGTIEARGAEGAVRFRSTENPTENYNKYFNASRDYSSDGLSILKCANNNSANCQGPGAGGGRIAINSRLIDNRGKLWAWGGGVSDSGSEQTDSQNSLDLVGTAGSVVIENVGSDVVVSILDIDKSVHRCNNNGISNLAACQAGQIDQNNATAQNSGWMLVKIRITNNTGVNQNNIDLTDEKFYYSAKHKAITVLPDGQGKWVDSASEVGWEKVVLNSGEKKVLQLQYAFEVQAQ